VLCRQLVDALEAGGAARFLGVPLAGERRGPQHPWSMAEARGSSPLSSTQQRDHQPAVVGAHEFRNHFGYFMERAAAGEVIRVTRRGRPTVRLTPA
jgi:prevent-host-death family protein